MDRPTSTRAFAIDLIAEPPMRVGAASIDPVSREAIFGDQRERLQPQNLKVLLVLARHRGAVVTREELIEQCWNGRFVGDDVINRSISLLRAFAARAGGFTIETVPKAGYRLVENGLTAAPPAHARWRFGAAAALALAGIVAAFFMLGGKPLLQGKPPVPTVALLPITPTGNEPLLRDVAQGARDALSHDLANSGFSVRLIDAVPDGAKPVADFVLSGDVRANGGSVEANVRMEESRNHTLVFTHRFEEPRDKASTLPDQIGASVATNLSWTGALMALDVRRSTDPAVSAELLRQLSMTVEGRDGLSAYQIARRIALQQPNSAIAQVALAFNTGFIVEELPREQRGPAIAVARQAAERAKFLAPEFGDVDIPWCLLHPSIWLAECEAHMRAGLRADPDAPFVSAFLSSLLNGVGRIDESLEMAQLALATDPYKPAKLSRVVRQLEATGDHQEAARVYAQSIRWWPHYGGLAWYRMLGLVQRGDLDPIEAFLPHFRPDMPPPVRIHWQAILGALKASDRDAAKRACSDVGDSPWMAAICLTGLARLGEMDQAYRLAGPLFPRQTAPTRAEEERLWLENPGGGFSAAILTSSAATAFRRDPRFVPLAEGLGLLAYWRTGALPDFCKRAPEPVCATIRRRPA